MNNATVTIYNFNGSALLHDTISGTTSIIDISSLSSGVYILKVKAGNNELVQKIVKE